MRPTAASEWWRDDLELELLILPSLTSEQLVSHVPVGGGQGSACTAVRVEDCAPIASASPTSCHSYLSLQLLDLCLSHSMLNLELRG